MLFRKKFRIAILVSGRGSNMEAIITAVKKRKLKRVQVALVLSDNPEAKALEIAGNYGIKALYLNPGIFKTKLEGKAEQNYIEELKKAKINLVVLAGFMRVIKPRLIRSFPNQIINIHPSLLPKYPGLHTHSRALEAHEKETGCTVHFVSEVVDGGKRIMQSRVKILPDDNEITLSCRVLEREHIIFPRVIGMIADGKIRCENLKDEPMEG